MTNATKQKATILKKMFANQLFSREDLKKVSSEIYVSLQTLKKWGLVERVSVEKKIEYSLEELLDTINEMIGDDCSDCDGKFIKEDDKIFFVRYFQKYRFK